MVAAARSVSSTMFLTVGIIYVWAIIFTNFFKRDNDFNGTAVDAHTGENAPNWFGRLGWSCMSLMQILVYDDTFALIRQVYIADKGMGLLLIVFIIVGAFTVLNMLIGKY